MKLAFLEYFYSTYRHIHAWHFLKVKPEQICRLPNLELKICRKALHRIEISSVLLHLQACASLLSLLKHSLVQKVKGSPINQPQSTLKHPNNLFIQMICSSVSDEVKSPICCAVPFYWCGRRRQQLQFGHALLPLPPQDHHSWAVRGIQSPRACLIEHCLGHSSCRELNFLCQYGNSCKGEDVLSIFIEGMTARKWVSLRLP